jgi:hypothetical protein
LLSEISTTTVTKRGSGRFAVRFVLFKQVVDAFVASRQWDSASQRLAAGQLPLHTAQWPTHCHSDASPASTQQNHNKVVIDFAAALFKMSARYRPTADAYQRVGGLAVKTAN